MTALAARISGIGYWSDGLPSWEAARAYVATGALAPDAPARPQPRLLPPNERRRAPESVAVALEVAQAACAAAAQDPARLPSVFASTHGDLAITDYMCAALATDPAAVSPIRFHNSVHNAAAGYWTIGNGCMAPTTAISAGPASFAQGLLEALSQLACGADAVLLAAFDARAVGPLATVARSEGLLGGALVLSREGPGPLLSARQDQAPPSPASGPLALRAAANAMAPMLPLLDALAANISPVILPAGPERTLRIELVHD